MKKRILSLVLAVLMVLAVTGCRGADPAPSNDPAPTSPSTPANSGGDNNEPAPANYKIGIITGTASQGDEEITQANKMKEKYPDLIVTTTYPDNFTSETETVISNAVALASDPDVKAIVWCQAIPATSAAIAKVRETRPDMLFIVGTPGEDPGVIDPKAASPSPPRPPSRAPRP